MKKRTLLPPFGPKGLSLIPGAGVAGAGAMITHTLRNMAMVMVMVMPGGMMCLWPARRDPAGSRGG